MRSMFSVVTPRIWVSPRSNSAEPCTRGTTSTSADSARMSLSAAAVDADLVAHDALAHELLGQRRGRRRRSPSRGPRTARRELLGGQRLDLVELGLALLLAGDGQRRRQLGLRPRPRRRRRRRPGSRGRPGTRRSPSRRPAASSACASHEHLDERLGGLEALRRRSPRSGAAAPSATSLSVSSVASASTIMIATSPSSSTRPATTMSNVGALELGVRREGDPLAVDQRDADAADRAGERQAGQLGGQRGGVDGDARRRGGRG